jgi:hypothetical protein
MLPGVLCPASLSRLVLSLAFFRTAGSGSPLLWAALGHVPLAQHSSTDRFEVSKVLARSHR